MLDSLSCSFTRSVTRVV